MYIVQCTLYTLVGLPWFLQQLFYVYSNTFPFDFQPNRITFGFKIDRNTVTTVIFHSVWKEREIYFSEYNVATTFSINIDSSQPQMSHPGTTFHSIWNFYDKVSNSIWNFCNQVSYATILTTLRKLYFYFLSHWMGYDRGDSFPFDFEPNGFPFGEKSKEKLSPWS